ncbi:MAG: PilZ domain-containing protein [Candidatus Omnitrophota bacterium]
MKSKMQNVCNGQNERRKYPRVSARIIYSLSNSAYLGNTTYTKDISAGGMCFISEQKIVKDNPLLLSVCLPGGKTFEAEAKVLREEEIQVLWTQEARYKVAVQFTKINAADQKKINHYVMKYLQENPS